MRVADPFRTSADRRCAQIQDTLKPLGRLTRIFSLSGPELVPKTRWQFFWFLSKALASATLLGLLNFFALFIKIRDHYITINLSIKLTDAVQMCFDYSQYLVDLLFVFKYGREIQAEYYKQYSNIDQYLTTTDYSAIKRRLITSIVYFAIIWIVSSVSDFTTISVSYGVLLPALCCPSYIFLLLRMFNTLDLMSHVMHIEFRLKCIVDQLQSCYRAAAAKHCQGEFSDPVCNKNWFYYESSSKIENTKVHPGCISLAAKVKSLSRCYLLLTEQCVFINTMYGTRVLLNSLSLLIDMIRFTNIAVRLIIGSQPTLYASGYYPATTNMVRMLTCASVVGSLVAQCERAYRQRDTAIAVIDHALVNTDPDAALKTELTQLRDLMQSRRRVEFHTAYFFRLDYAFLVSLISVMVTYTIILIQSLPN